MKVGTGKGRPCLDVQLIDWGQAHRVLIPRVDDAARVFRATFFNTLISSLCG